MNHGNKYPIAKSNNKLKGRYEYDEVTALSGK